MFDLAGQISTSGPGEKHLLPTIWKNYLKELNIDYRGNSFSHGMTHMYMLNTPGEQTKLAREKNLSVVVYGDCYPRLNTVEHASSKHLCAADLLRMYRLEGLRFLDRIKGNFVLFFTESDQNITHIIAAPLNLKPLYYRESRNGLLFSTSLPAMKALLESHGVATAADDASLIEYYLFDFMLGGHTMLENVKELAAGSLLRIDDQGVHFSEYTDPVSLFPLTDHPLQEKEAGDLLADVLESNIALLTDGPQDTAIALTGGYDSRSIAALTGDDFNSYQYYSYGAPESWDIKIPQQLARENELDYQLIDLSSEFKQDFAFYARQAVLLGDGTVEANRANYLYVYSNFLTEKTSVLSGLFGSELIKNPTSRGLFIDEHILTILQAEDPEQAFDKLYDQMLSTLVFPTAFARAQREEVKRRVLQNDRVCNALPVNQKLLYFIMMVGCRKYFVKEMKLERFLINTRTPFFDIDFIRALLRTPFPWVYNWTGEKSLLKNLKIHRLYARLIRRKKGLLRTLSTHGFQPSFLLSFWYYPLLATQFILTKKKIAKQSELSFEEDIRYFFSNQTHTAHTVLPINADHLEQMAVNDYKNYVKLKSLNYWMRHYGVCTSTSNQPTLRR